MGRKTWLSPMFRYGLEPRAAQRLPIAPCQSKKHPPGRPDCLPN